MGWRRSVCGVPFLFRGNAATSTRSSASAKVIMKREHFQNITRGNCYWVNKQYNW